jgi:hypothetical protein
MTCKPGGDKGCKHRGYNLTKELHDRRNLVKHCSIHDHHALFALAGLAGDIRLVRILQPLQKHLLIVVCYKIEINVNPGVITGLLFNYNSPLTIKDENGLKKGVTVGHSMEDYSGLSLVPATAVSFAGHGGHLLPVIGVTVEEFEGQGGLVDVED